MGYSEGRQEKQLELSSRIQEYVNQTTGLTLQLTEAGDLQIYQKVDSKTLVLKFADLDDVLLRSDADGQDFIQINFITGQKLLVTNALIGFKPAQLPGLDMSKLPRVVTTPDVVSVFEAIQEALHAGDVPPAEVDVLKKVFDSVVTGGETIGFDLSQERSWLLRLPTTVIKVTA